MQKPSHDFDAIRRALKRIDHADDRERAIGVEAEAALERLQRRLSELEKGDTKLPPTEGQAPPRISVSRKQN